MNYYLWLIINFFKNIFLFLLDLLKRLFWLIRYVLYKTFLTIWTVSTIGKWIAIVLLALNVIEAFEGTFITKTKYFSQMLILFGAEMILHLICFILKPRDLSDE